MNLLLLGGTAFLGRAVATAARDSGWDVTCLARGSAPTVEGVSLVPADRDDDDALSRLRGTVWDVVVDLTRHPGHARRAVRDLVAEHWVFVSSGNVYAAFDRLEQGEDSALLEPLDADVMADMSEYGAAKVACENAVRAARDEFTIIRSGLIGGFGDWSGRSGYYPWRFAHPTGPDVLAPPDPDFPTALIDVEDLAAWILECGRRHIPGVFNVTGPTTPLADLLQISRAVVNSAAIVRHVPAHALAAAGVACWMGPASLPLWIDDPSWRFFATLDCSAARAHGLRTRPLSATLAAALRYENRRDRPREAGLTDDEERRLRGLLS